MYAHLRTILLAEDMGLAVGRDQSCCDCVLLNWASLAYDLHQLCLRLRLVNRCARATSKKSESYKR